MAKIGIMSMQRIKNYGSFLQAYGLKSIIESLGYDVEFVDYHVEKSLIETKKRKKGLIRKIDKVLEVLRYDAKFIHKVQYIIHKKNFDKKYFNVLNISEQKNYNPELDILVIGSDEVFNCIQKNENVGYSLELFGKNSNAKKIITYAASFGNTTIQKLKEYNKADEIANLLKKMDKISVRDENSYNIVKELTDCEVNINLDPVLIYDYMNKCNEIKKMNNKEKFMIVYAYNGRLSLEESEYIKKFAQEKKLKIYSIGGAQKCADKFIDCSPFEVLSYFREAEYVVTDTFHGSIFSIITNKKFLTLVRKSVGTEYGNEEKLTDLLNRLSLNDRIIYDLNKIKEKIDDEINYDIVNEIIKNNREKAILYLKESFDGNGKNIDRE